MMKLKVQQVFDATPVLGKIIDEKRPIPGKGVYRITRTFTKLNAEWTTIAERYNAMVRAYEYKRPLLAGERVEPTEENLQNPNIVMQDAVPDDKFAEFQAAWKEIGEEEITVEIEPIPIDQLCIDGQEGSISFAEFATLGELVAG